MKVGNKSVDHSSRDSEYQRKSKFLQKKVRTANELNKLYNKLRNVNVVYGWDKTEESTPQTPQTTAFKQ